jgi:hypothetical protein
MIHSSLIIAIKIPDARVRGALWHLVAYILAYLVSKNHISFLKKSSKIYKIKTRARTTSEARLIRLD